ncbi:MAG TPA: tetratricopeptide repeat protein [Planctomycetaceae bacterium]|jgi:tetratricopeptide (TPR) repeat protein|nr:tetratricopeptide repeat protein [Planctomycetaceae bacterium]
MRRARLATLFLTLFLGCAPASHETARQLFDRTLREYHLPSAEASGPQREKLLAQSATGYELALQLGGNDRPLCAAALRSLANVRAEQGRLDEAVKLWSQVGERYPTCDWEILQSWKSAADLLWDAGRQSDAAPFYRQIFERFRSAPSPIMRTVARAASRRV